MAVGPLSRQQRLAVLRLVSRFRCDQVTAAVGVRAQHRAFRAWVEAAEVLPPPLLASSSSASMETSSSTSYGTSNDSDGDPWGADEDWELWAQGSLHPPHWNPIRHFGRCGQSCPCCRARVGELMGACPVCIREAGQPDRRDAPLVACPGCDTEWTLDDDTRDWHTSSTRPYCSVCSTPLALPPHEDAEDAGTLAEDGATVAGSPGSTPRRGAPPPPAASAVGAVFSAGCVRGDEASPVWAIRGWVSPGSYVGGRISAFRDLDSSGFQAGWIGVSDGGPDAYFRPRQLDRALSELLEQDPSGQQLLGREVRFRLEYRRNGHHRQAGGVVQSQLILGPPPGPESERVLGDRGLAALDLSAAESAWATVVTALARAAAAAPERVAAGSPCAMTSPLRALRQHGRSDGAGPSFAPTEPLAGRPLVPIGGACALCLAPTGWTEPYGVLCLSCGGRGAPGTSAWALAGALSTA